MCVADRPRASVHRLRSFFEAKYYTPDITEMNIRWNKCH